MISPPARSIWRGDKGQVWLCPLPCSERLAHLAVRREIEGALAGPVLDGWVRAARKERGGNACMAALGRDHQRGAAAVVGGVDRRAGVEQQLDDIESVALAES